VNDPEVYRQRIGYPVRKVLMKGVQRVAVGRGLCARGIEEGAVGFLVGIAALAVDLALEGQIGRVAEYTVADRRKFLRLSVKRSRDSGGEGQKQNSTHGHVANSKPETGRVGK